MSEYDMPICKQHQKEMNAALSKAMVAMIVALGLSFIAGFAFCRIVVQL
jgi:hypothetical protein